MLIKRIIENGIRISVKAQEILENAPYDENIIKEIIALKKRYITELDVKPIVEKNKEKKIIVKRASRFKPIAKEYSSDIKVLESDVTGKSTTKGLVDDFIAHFQNRFKKLSALLRKTDPRYPEAYLGRITNNKGQNARIVVMVTQRHNTKKGNLMFFVEDLTGTFNVVITKKDPKLFELAQSIMLDDVVAFRGKILDGIFIAYDVEWPDMPITRQRKYSENDLSTAYLSDIHFGSKKFLNKYFERFLDWIHGKNGAVEIASKLKYIVVAGDIVDGVGIYPNQEKELAITDIYKQYQVFNDFIERLPDYVEVIAIPGNHDAVRRAEPCPALEKDLVSAPIHALGNPTTVAIEGLKHILYHGNSMDSMISNLAHLSYDRPETVMKEYLKRRHFSPIYGGNLIIPERTDYLVIEEEPDVMHTGHVHKNGYGLYRGTVMINSGTFQDRTDFQIRQGHVPTPGMVPIYEMMTGKLKTLDFKRV